MYLDVQKKDDSYQTDHFAGVAAGCTEKLTEARDRLLAAADRMNHLNDQNVALIKQAIELNEFDLTLFKSLRQAPETANYDKTACNTGSLLGSSGFDAMS